MRRVGYLFVLFFLLQFNSSATEFIVWKAENIEYKIYFDKSMNAYFSQDCLKKMDCLAKKLVLKARNQKNIDIALNESINPGSPICVKYEGKVLLARNSGHSEVAFCQLSDKSMVELSGIVFAK